MLHAALGGAHNVLQAVERFGLAARVEEEAHAPAGHAAEHPEAPEIAAHFGADRLDQRRGVEVAGPRNDGLDGAIEIAAK